MQTDPDPVFDACNAYEDIELARSQFGHCSVQSLTGFRKKILFSFPS
jgi:hypothetical protein